MATATAVILALVVAVAVVIWRLLYRLRAELRGRERYARAMEASNEGLWDWDIVTGRLFQSVRAKELLGLPPDASFASREEFMRRTPFHPEDRQHVERALTAAMAGETDRYEVDYRIVPPDGQVRWVRARGKVFRDRTQRPVRTAGTLLDVTDQKLAQESLRESEVRFRSLTELSSDWYWRQDENLRFTYLSSQANDLTGYTGESSYGKARWELANMWPLSCTWDEHRAVLEARQAFRDLECCRIGPDGRVRYLSMSGAPIFDDEGRFKGYHGVGRNITERRRIEEELRARQEMLDLAQRAARAAAFEWSLGAGAGQSRWSPELETMLGLPPGSYDGSFEAWRRLVMKADLASVNAAISHAHLTGEVAFEYRVAHANGSVRWLQLKGRLVLDGSRQPVRLVGFMLDVTERHQNEEDLRRLEQQLRQAQRLEAMGTLAGGIAHDFNNILGAILGYGEMALREASAGSRLRRDLDSIMTAGERGRALVEQILTFSRNSGAERVLVHTERVVREALDHLSPRLPRNIVVDTRLRSGRAAVKGDPTQVHQVVMNLVTNASQAMSSGGILRVDLDLVRFDMHVVTTTGTLPAGAYVALEVRDCGGGIAPEILERIFDPFFTTKEVGIGTGLGLSLVHGIVTELGGAVNVRSEPGVGSTFTVYLPRVGDAEEVAQERPRAAPRGNGERVLVVDDEQPLMLIATETLEDYGYKPLGFTSSTAALEAFRADPGAFDAVVTDERMPGLTGSALIKELRAMRAGIPAILMSGFFAIPPAGSDGGTRADEVLKKPLSGRDLAASVARVLQRSA